MSDGVMMRVISMLKIKMIVKVKDIIHCGSDIC